MSNWWEAYPVVSPDDPGLQAVLSGGTQQPATAVADAPQSSEKGEDKWWEKYPAVRADARIKNVLAEVEAENNKRKDMDDLHAAHQSLETYGEAVHTAGQIVTDTTSLVHRLFGNTEHADNLNRESDIVNQAMRERDRAYWRADEDPAAIEAALQENAKQEAEILGREDLDPARKPEVVKYFAEERTRLTKALDNAPKSTLEQAGQYVPFLKQGIRGAARSLGTAVLGAKGAGGVIGTGRVATGAIQGARAAGTAGAIRGAGAAARAVEGAALQGSGYGAIALASSQEANRAITEGKDAGLEGSLLAKYVASQGVIEALPASVMQYVGLGGMEAMIAGPAIRGGVKAGIIQSIKHLGNEIPEELVTEIGHAVANVYYGVDKQALDRENLQNLIADTILQTVIMLGATGASRVPGQVASGDTERAQAKRLARLKEIGAPTEKTPVEQSPPATTQSASGLALESVAKTVIDGAMQKLSTLDKPPGAHKWAEVVLGDRKRYKEAPDEATRTSLWEQSRGVPQGSTAQATQPQYRNRFDFGTGEPQGDIPAPPGLALIDRLRERLKGKAAPPATPAPPQIPGQPAVQQQGPPPLSDATGTGQQKPPLPIAIRNKQGTNVFGSLVKETDDMVVLEFDDGKQQWFPKSEWKPHNIGRTEWDAPSTTPATPPAVPPAATPKATESSEVSPTEATAQVGWNDVAATAKESLRRRAKAEQWSEDGLKARLDHVDALTKKAMQGNKEAQNTLNEYAKEGPKDASQVQPAKESVQVQGDATQGSQVRQDEAEADGTEVPVEPGGEAGAAVTGAGQGIVSGLYQTMFNRLQEGKYPGIAKNATDDAVAAEHAKTPFQTPDEIQEFVNKGSRAGVTPPEATPKQPDVSERDQVENTPPDVELTKRGGRTDKPGQLQREQDKPKQQTGVVQVLSDKHPELKERFAQDAGVSEGYTVGEHTQRVVERLDIADIPKRQQRLMELTAALHDIGKGEAVASGEKSKQHQYTLPVMRKILKAEGFTDADIAFAEAMVDQDIIGEMLQGKMSPMTAATKLETQAKRAGIDKPAFLTMAKALYKADAGSYPRVEQAVMPEGKITDVKLAMLEEQIHGQAIESPWIGGIRTAASETGRQGSARETALIHASAYDIQEFDASKDSGKNLVGPGVYLLTTEDADVAQHYADRALRRVLGLFSPKARQRIESTKTSEEYDRLILLAQQKREASPQDAERWSDAITVLRGLREGQIGKLVHTVEVDLPAHTILDLGADETGGRVLTVAERTKIANAVGMDAETLPVRGTQFYEAIAKVKGRKALNEALQSIGYRGIAFLHKKGGYIRRYPVLNVLDPADANIKKPVAAAKSEVSPIGDKKPFLPKTPFGMGTMLRDRVVAKVQDLYDTKNYSESGLAATIKREVDAEFGKLTTEVAERGNLTDDVRDWINGFDANKFTGSVRSYLGRQETKAPEKPAKQPAASSPTTTAEPTEQSEFDDAALKALDDILQAEKPKKPETPVGDQAPTKAKSGQFVLPGMPGMAAEIDRQDFVRKHRDQVLERLWGWSDDPTYAQNIQDAIDTMAPSVSALMNEIYAGKGKDINDVHDSEAYGKVTAAASETVMDATILSGVDDAAKAALAERPKPRTLKKPRKSEQTFAEAKSDLKAAHDAAKQLMKKIRGDKPMSGVDPTLMAETVQVAYLYTKAGIKTFKGYVEAIVENFGDSFAREFAPYMESGWRALHTRAVNGITDPAGKVEDFLTEMSDEKTQDKPGTERDEAVGDGTGESQGDAATTGAGTNEGRDVAEDAGQPSDSILPDDAETAQDDGRKGGRGSGADGDIDADKSEQGSAGATDTGAGSSDGAMDERLAVNHVIGQDDDLAVSSLTESLARNIKALDILKVLEKDGRFPDEAERKALAQYTGWGGLSQALDSIKGERMLSEHWMRDEAWEKKWGKAYRTLKSLLSKEEFQAAQDSTENAHYTSKPIIQAIWKIAERLGYNQGRVLELGAGVGHFAGLVPSRVRGATQFTMVERDSVSSRITKMLYPNHEVVAGDMEEFKTVPGSVTLGIGNVPFAGGTVGDSLRRYDEQLNLHNYSIARHLDAVAPGGIVVVVSSHSTLDANIKQRKFLATKGELIGAIRLPNNAFAENAKTEVVTDILIFRRPRQGDGTLGVRIDQNADVKVKNKDGEEVSRAINKYFTDNPEMVLGKHSAKGSMYGPDEYTVESTPGDLQSKLDAAIEKLPRDLLGSVDVAEKVVASDESVPFGRLEIRDGKVVMGYGDKFVPILGKKFEGFPVHLTGKTGVSRAKDYVGLRDVLADVRKTMLDETATDKDVKRAQSKLSASYDKYVKEYGPLNSAKTNIFKRDPDYYRVLALENERGEYNPETKKIEVTYTKAAIFTDRVLGPQKEPNKADSPADAMSISVAWRGAIDSAFIGKLLGVSSQEAEAKLLDEGLAFRNPSTTELELSELYLSGNVRAKLEQAKISSEEDSQYARNVEALTKVQPKPVTLKKDTVRLGATWIPEQVINAFAAQEFGTDVRVSYNANTDAWTVGSAYGISETAKAKYETERIDADQLLSEVLNLRSIKIYDKKETGEYTSSGKPKTTQVLNEKETQSAKHRASVLRAEFEKWVLSNPEVTQVLAKLYNDKYNNFVRTKYNGDFLVLPGANPEVKLRPYQKDAIWRIINRGTSLLAHAVGAGKTYTMIGAAMEMRRLGLARRPLLVVQNATLGQFATSFQQMYPNANVLVADKDDLGKGKRQLFLNKVSTGNWDAVVMAQSTFDNMASDPDVERAFIQDQLDLLEEEAIREEGGEGAKTPTVKQLVRTKKSLKKRFDKLMGSRAKKEDNVTFEDMGADALFLDEAHAYKKPTFTTKLSQLVGLNVEPSARSLATTIKVRSIQSAHNGRNVILATGTPVTNTLGEAWHMVNYVSPATNAAFSSRTFDQFIANFAQVEPTLTMNAGGQYVYKDAIVKFRNGHQLVEYINDSWDIVTPDALRAYMASSKKGFPQLRGGQPSAITVDRTPGVAVFMDFISRVYTKYKGLTAKERRELSFIPALAYGASKAATLDIRLVVPNAAEEKNSKLQKAAEEIKRIYDESAEVKGAQLFFSDMKNPFSMSRLNQFMDGDTIDGFGEDVSTDETITEDETAESVDVDDNESGSFLYQELKRKLLAMGIPKEQIAFISDAKTDKQRQALFERVNNGDIRVLIGSTAKMGVGVNVQNKLVALHHFDTPWLPADLEQREGRILRFGNENETVEILRYAMKKTLDGAIYMSTARKQKFIWQVLNGQLDGDSFEDPSSAAMLSIEEQLAAIQDDPVFFEKIEIQNRLRELELERQSFYDAQQRIANSLSREKFWLNREEATTRPQWQRRLEKVEKLQAIKGVGGLETFSMTYGNQTFDNPKDAAKFIQSKGDELGKYVVENHDKLQSFDKAGGLLNLRSKQKLEFQIGPAKIVVGAEPRGAFVENADGKTVTEYSATFKSVAYMQEPGGRYEFYEGNAKTPKTFFDKMQSLPEEARTELNRSEAAISKYQAKIAELEGLQGKQWEDQAEYDAKKERLAEIEGQMLASKGNLAAEETAERQQDNDGEGGGTASGDFGRDVGQTLGITSGVPLAGPHRGMGRSVQHFFQRFFTSQGELPADVYDAKVRKEGRVSQEMNRLRNRATDLQRGIKKALGGKTLTQADLEKMNAVLRGEAPPSTIPAEVRAPIKAMRDHIDSLSSHLILEGVAQGDLVGTIANNMGVYATRSYRVFDNPKWRDKVPEAVRNRAIAAIRALDPSRPDAEVAGILESLLYRGAADSPVALLKGSKLGSKDLSTFIRRQDIPEWLRELWGEYKDAGVNYARSVFKMAHLLSNQQFLNEVRDAGLGKWLRTGDDGPIVNEHGEVITKIAADASSVMAPLNGLYTTPEIKKAFERFDSPGAMPEWLRMIMSVNYAVKYGKTVGSVMTHVRNMVSNVGFAVANAHWRLDKAGKAVWGTATGTFQLSDAKFREYYNRLAELGVVGEDVRAGELKDALRDASKADIDEFLYNREERHAKKLIDAGRAGFRFLNSLYQAEDGVWKIYAFENEKARYTKAYPQWSEQQVEEHAAKIVRNTYPTYSKIPEAIKSLRRFPVVGTFVSFPSEVVRTTFHTVALGIEEMRSQETRSIGAQRLAGAVVAAGTLSVLSRAMMAMFGIGNDEDEDLRWFVAPWQENSRFIYLGKPKDATFHFVDLGYSDPHAYLTDSMIAFMRGDDWKDSLVRATSEFMEPFVSQEILFKAGVEAIANEDQKVYNEHDEIGEQAKGIVSHMWSNALEPGTISSARRIHTAILGTDPSKSVRDEVLAVTTGQRLQKVDVEHSLGFRVRDFGKALIQIQGIARKTATSRGTATGGMVVTDLQRMEKLRLAAFAEMQKITGAARRLGVPEESIRAMLTAELPDNVAEQLITGDYSAYEMTPQTMRQMMGAKPDEFMQRFEAWHGQGTPEVIQSYVGPRVANLDKDSDLVKIKNELDLLAVTFDEASQSLKDYWKLKHGSAYEKGGKLKDAVVSRLAILRTMYGIK